MVERTVLRAALAFALLSSVQLATAACNNPKNWLESPTQGVKYFVGYEPDMRTMTSFGSEMLVGQPERMAYPPLLPKEMWDKSGSGEFSQLGAVSYYEADGRGNWRLCRRESWIEREYAKQAEGKSGTDVYLRNQKPGNALVAKFGPGLAATRINAYVFDAKNRLIQKVDVSVEPKGAQLSQLECYRYDDKDSVLLYVDAKTSGVCPSGEPDVHDDWMKTQVEWVDGKRIYRRFERNFGDDQKWRREIGTSSRPDGTGDATLRADSVRGVYEVSGTGFGKKDDNGGTTTAKAGGGIYTFTERPVPLTLADNREELYKYPRRRELTLGSAQIKLVEWFPANSHVSPNRYILGAGSVLRHEQRNADGKLKRAINVAFEKFAGQPDALYDEPVIKKPLMLKGHEYLYRVWDYDAQGQGTLVAIGWNRSFKEKPMDLAPIAFGTPDGKEKWKTKEEFFKAFGFDSKAEGAHLSRE